MWLSLLCNKSNLSLLFPNFKALVENYSILQLSPYTQMAERNIQPFNPYLIPTAFNISKPPYTPQYNGSTKRWHRHIIETELTLLYQASIPLSYWSYAFLIATCLINKLPTPILSLVSPLEKLFSKQPNYHKQKKNCCLCYPWLHPYTHHKLDPKVTPCIFLVHSSHQRLCLCLDPSMNKL